jgi:phage terminase large subunit
MPDGSLPFDWRNPDYVSVFRKRAEVLAKLRADPALLARTMYYYKNGHIDDFINDWGITVDVRVSSKGRSPIMPMVLWPKQREYVRWLYARWKANEEGTVVKSRDVGISWLAMGFSVGMSIFYDDLSIGFGSEKEDKVDRSGDPDCLFYKGRMFLRYLPAEFRGGWTLGNRECSAHMRLVFPLTGSSITGEAGDNIGRGGRKAMYFVDESAHVPNPKAIDASLSANTECRIDMSSVNGMANSFAERAHNPNIARFDFALEDDPRRDEEYWRKKRATLDPVIFAAEYERNFQASVSGVVIPSMWVTAAVDAHKKLGLVPSGQKRGAMDVADSGSDANAFAVGQDFLVSHVESWHGSADLDIFHSVEHAFLMCDVHDLDGFLYDGDGLGAGVRGDARKVNQTRRENKLPLREVDAFRGSGEVFQPEKKVPGTERTAEDFFENCKAQTWWLLRFRFQYTYRALEHLAQHGTPPPDLDPSEIISIASDFPERARLCTELSQPVWATSKRGKVMVDKCPVGTKTEVRNAIKSPNLADSVMMLFAPRRMGLSIHPSLLNAVGAVHAAQRR